MYNDFKKNVARKKMFREGEKILAAVSGGADSLALLELLHRLASEYSLDLYVAHLNHGLRGEEASRDAVFVQEEACRRGLPFLSREISVLDYRKNNKSLSLEEAARKVRYYYLEEEAWRLGAAKVAVGHHRDDQVETVLLNLIRGTGLDGLSGMREMRPLGKRGVQLVRPLLPFSRGQIEEFCREEKLSYMLDATNLDPGFSRNKVRLQLLPLLEKDFNPKIKENLARLAAILCRERHLLEKHARELFYRSLHQHKAGFLSFRINRLFRQGDALAFRVLRRGLRILLGGVPRNLGQQHLADIRQLCHSSSPHSRLDLPGGVKAQRSYNLLIFTLAAGQIVQKGPHKETGEVILRVPGRTYLPFALQEGKKACLQAQLVHPSLITYSTRGSCQVYLDWHKLKNKVLKARLRRQGDRFFPLNAPGSKKLKDFLIDRKVPLEERDNLVLLTAGEDVIWVVGMEIAHPYRITSQTRRALLLAYGEEGGLGRR